MIAMRSPDESDFENWLRLWRSYQDFYAIDISLETSLLTWARLLDPIQPVNAALAIADHNPVGFAHWIFHPSCWTVGEYCYFQDLFVIPEHRGSGVGRALLDHVREAARLNGCSRVYWLTSQDNHVARSLYDKVADLSPEVRYVVELS